MPLDELEADPLGELADDFVERHRLGGNPSIDEYIAQRPELEQRIRELFPLLVLIEDHSPEADSLDESDAADPAPSLERIGDFRILREVGRGGMGVVYEAVQESLGRHVALKVFPTHSNLNPRHRERFKRESRSAAMLHHTNIVPVFSVGEEDGLLYYAMQFINGVGLDEVIDELEALRSTGAGSTQVYLSSRQANAASNIAEVLLSHGGIGPGESERKAPPATGTVRGEIEGSSSAAAGSEADKKRMLGSGVHLPGQSDENAPTESGDQYWKSVARIGVQVADALEYAHGLGTLHRDIKPSNLLLDTNANVWVTDFGLAKSSEQDDLTHTGELIGTLRYMPPEQLSGHADERSDLYSLGLALYEMLTLRPAFDKPDRNAVIKSISEDEAISPRRINPKIPRDLETIVLKAIEREPARRYQAAAELASDLNRFVNNEPIHARRVRAQERVIKWARRRPAVAGLSVALVVVFMAAFSLVTWQWQDAVAAREEARVERDEARKAERKQALQRGVAEELLGRVEEHRYQGLIARAELKYLRNNPPQAEVSLDLAAPRAGETDRRGWEWGYLRGVLSQELLTLPAGTRQAPWVADVGFSADGRRIASAASAPVNFLRTRRGVRGAAKVWDAETGLPVADFTGNLLSVRSVALNADGSQLATADYDPEEPGPFRLRVWDVGSKAQIVDWTDRGPVRNLTFSPDDSLLTADSVGQIKTWDAATGQLLFELPGNGFEYSDDSKSLTVYGNGGDRATTRYDTANGDVLSVSETDAPRAVGDLIRDPTRTYYAFISHRNAIKVHRVADGKQVHVFRHEMRVWKLAFSPDGKLLASSGGDGTVRLWELASGQPVAIYRGHTDHVISLAFDPTGDRLISGDWAGSLRVWDVTRHPERLSTFISGPGVVEALAFTRDGDQIVSAWQFSDSHVYLLKSDARTGLQLGRSGPRLNLCRELTTPGRLAAFDRNAKLLVGVSDTDRKNLNVWDVETKKPQRELVGHRRRVHYTAVSGNGSRAASASNALADEIGEVKLWDLRTGLPSLELEGLGLITSAMAVSDGGEFVAISGAARGELTQRSRVSAKSNRSFDARPGYFLEIWDVTQRRQLHSLRVSSPALALSFDPRSNDLAVADSSAVTLRSLGSGQVLNRADVIGRVEDLTFSPDGRRLVGAMRTQTTVWNTETLHDLLILGSLPRMADKSFNPRVAFSPDGSLLASGQWDGTVWLRSARDRSARELDWARIRSERRTRERGVVPGRFRGWWLAALAQLNRRIEQNPNDLRLIGRRVRVHRKLNNWELAQADSDRMGNALYLSEQDHVAAKHIPLDEYGAFTVEFWIRNWQKTIFYQGNYYGKVGEGTVQLRAQANALVGGLDICRPNDYGFLNSQTFTPCSYSPNQWAHIAVVYDGENRSIFVDGKRNGKPVPTEPPGPYHPDRPFWIAYHPVPARLHGNGLMRSLRVSKVARYVEDFSPAENLDADEDAVLLYDFAREEGRVQGNHIPDLSRSGNHGKIISSWWVD